MTLYLGVSGEVFAYSSNKEPGSEEVSGWEEASVADSETAEEVDSKQTGWSVWNPQTGYLVSFFFIDVHPSRFFRLLLTFSTFQFTRKNRKMIPKFNEQKKILYQKQSDKQKVFETSNFVHFLL